MHKPNILFAAVLLVVLSCNTDILQENESMAVDKTQLHQAILSPLVSYQSEPSMNLKHQAKEAKMVTRPMKLSSSGTIAFTTGSASCEGYILVSIDGTGNGTHLGNFTVTLNYCSDGVNPVGPILGVQTAASGDQLFTALVGADVDEVGYYQDYIYYGGTGRFENATGSIRLYSTIDYANLTFSNFGEGVINF
jgi:hypothetical protein